MAVAVNPGSHAFCCGFYSPVLTESNLQVRYYESSIIRQKACLPGLQLSLVLYENIRNYYSRFRASTLLKETLTLGAIDIYNNNFNPLYAHSLLPAPEFLNNIITKFSIPGYLNMFNINLSESWHCFNISLRKLNTKILLWFRVNRNSEFWEYIKTRINIAYIQRLKFMLYYMKIYGNWDMKILHEAVKPRWEIINFV